MVSVFNRNNTQFQFGATGSVVLLPLARVLMQYISLKAVSSNTVQDRIDRIKNRIDYLGFDVVLDETTVV